MPASLTYKHFTDPNELLQRFAAGDENAFRFIYDEYYLNIFRFAKKFVVNRQASEDITTDIFLKLWEKRTGFEEMNSLKSFLFTSVKNACLNYLRDEKRHAITHGQLIEVLAFKSESDLIPEAITEKVYQFLEAEILQLPEKMKKIVQLHLQGMKNAEIALEVGIAEKTVRNLKAEAVKLLKIALLKNELLLILLFATHF